MIQAYTDVYTGEEIDGMLAFYRSPAGRAMVSKYPHLMTRVKSLAGEQRLLDEEIRKMIATLKPAE